LQPSTLAKRAWVAVFVAIAIFYFYGLTAIPFIGPDEPRYAEVAREMLLRRELITPTLGGFPWFQKPPLLYWMMMASFRVLGVSEYAARLAPEICGLLIGLLVYLVARRVERHSSAESSGPDGSKCGLAAWSAVALLSSAGIIVFSRAVAFDMPVTMTTTAALACFFLAEADGRSAPGSERVTSWDARTREKRRRWLLAAFYACVGLSLLAKGLLGVVIPFAVIGLYFLLRRELPRKSMVHSVWWGIPVALSVAGLWYGPMIARHGWPFIDDFLVQRHFARFVSNEYPQARRFYYYLPFLSMDLSPWTIVFVAGLIESRRWHWRGPRELDRLRVFAMAWFIAPLVFFSLAETKLPGYILPVLPGAALLVGDRLVGFLKSGRGIVAVLISGVLALLLAPAGGYYAVRHLGVPRGCALASAIPAVVAGGFIVLWHAHLARDSRVASPSGWLRPWRNVTVWLVVAATFTAWLAVIVCATSIFPRRESFRAQIRLAGARGYGDAPIYNLYKVERSSEFYAAGRVVYGANGEPLKLENVGQVAEVVRRQNDPVLVIVPIEYLWQLTESKIIQSEVISDNGDLVLVAVRAK
jgi:4-amino-4-deoxy-L-arabinose transferase-like glycosyltransferase